MDEMYYDVGFFINKHFKKYYVHISDYGLDIYRKKIKCKQENLFMQFMNSHFYF